MHFFFIFSCVLYHTTKEVLEYCLHIGKASKDFVLKCLRGDCLLVNMKTVKKPLRSS